MSDNFGKFTAGARKVLARSHMEAERLGHPFVGTEHILLGLLIEESGIASRVLAGLGIHPRNTCAAIEFIIGRSDHSMLGEFGLSRRAKKVIQLAMDEARSLDHNAINTGHLLLGLAREYEQEDRGILERVGIDPVSLRRQTIRQLSQLGLQPTTTQSEQDELDASSPPEKKLRAIERNLENARAGGDQARVARIEYMLSRERVHDLDAQRNRLFRWLVALEKQRMETDGDIRDVIDQIEFVQRERQAAIERRDQASSTSYWASQNEETAGENESEDRPSAQE